MCLPSNGAETCGHVVVLRRGSGGGGARAPRRTAARAPRGRRAAGRRRRSGRRASPPTRSTSGASGPELVGDQHDRGAVRPTAARARRRGPAGWAGRRRRSARRGRTGPARRPGPGRSGRAAAGRRRGWRCRRGPRSAGPTTSIARSTAARSARDSGRNSRRWVSRPEATTSHTDAGTPLSALARCGTKPTRDHSSYCAIGVPKSRRSPPLSGQQPDQGPDQRRLARAVGAHQGHELPGSTVRSMPRRIGRPPMATEPLVSSIGFTRASVRLLQGREVARASGSGRSGRRSRRSGPRSGRAPRCARPCRGRARRRPPGSPASRRRRW